MPAIAKPRRLGLFGGTFDPVHRGHLQLAQAAVEQLQLDELLWLPAGAPWQKQPPRASGEHRAAMLRAALDTLQPALHRIDEREMHRSGPTYTIDTVDELDRERTGAAGVASPPCDWYLVIGQDQYARLDTWHRWRELLARVRLAVVARNGQAPVPSAAVAAAMPRMQVLHMPAAQVSSTAIRERRREGGSIAGMVPDAVARYIDHHGLYR